MKNILLELDCTHNYFTYSIYNCSKTTSESGWKCFSLYLQVSVNRKYSLLLLDFFPSKCTLDVRFKQVKTHHRPN